MDVLPKNRFSGNQLQLMDDDGAESEPENAEPAQRDVASREETDNLPIHSDPDAGAMTFVCYFISHILFSSRTVH